MATTKIEWANKVWNPITGCSPISEGCQHCYAARMAKRLAGRYGYPAGDGFAVTLHPDKLDEPLKWKKPCRIFVCSMGDLFHDGNGCDDIKNIWDVMFDCPRHTFIILTKRPMNMKQFSLWMKQEGRRMDYPNIWLGVTAENQARTDERIPILLSIPAAKHFVSVEPMLSKVDLGGPLNGYPEQVSEGHWEQTYPPLDWVIAGPETGPGARECKPEWIKDLADQCESAGVPFFEKRKNFIRREWPKSARS